MNPRIADYEDYLAALPEGLQKRILTEEYEAHLVDTEPREDIESYLEACEQANERYDAQIYESRREERAING